MFAEIKLKLTHAMVHGRSHLHWVKLYDKAPLRVLLLLKDSTCCRSAEEPLQRWRGAFVSQKHQRGCQTLRLHPATAS